MSLFSRWINSNSPPLNPLKWDMHNHILFGIDDGSKSIEQSLDMARKFIDLGYERVVATPHIMSDYYPNTRIIIQEKKMQVEKALLENHLPLKIDFAAEYYMDEFFFAQVQNKEELLTFHNNHLLIETSFMNKPVFFDQLLFDIRTIGYTPILAHPERYIYFHENYEEAERIIQTGIKFQINLLSLASYYSPMVKKFAQWLIKNGYYHFLGTDAHTTEQLQILKSVFDSKLFSQIDLDKVENAR